MGRSGGHLLDLLQGNGAQVLGRSCAPARRERASLRSGEKLRERERAGEGERGLVAYYRAMFIRHSAVVCT
jgi:hypothetical protein